MDGRANFNYGGLTFFASVLHPSGPPATGSNLMASDHDNSNCDSLGGEFEPYQPPNPNFLGTGFPRLLC